LNQTYLLNLIQKCIEYVHGCDVYTLVLHSTKSLLKKALPTCVAFSYKM